MNSDKEGKLANFLIPSKSNTLSFNAPPITTKLSFSLAKLVVTLAAATTSLEKVIAVGPENNSDIFLYGVPSKAILINLFLVTLKVTSELLVFDLNSLIESALIPS